jgi:hypothetical protein
MLISSDYLLVCITVSLYTEQQNKTCLDYCLVEFMLKAFHVP